MAISKVVYGGTTLIDLTGDTVEADKILKGFKTHGADGEPIVGTCDFDTKTADITTLPSEVLKDKPFGRGGNVEIGTMPNNGAVTGEISTKAGTYTVPQGYHDGGGKVAIDSTEQAKLIPDNIREGVTILGVAGTMSGTEDAKPQAKEVTPSTEQQVVLPDTGFNYLSQVTVKAIPYVESDNSAGGKTVTIG